MGEVEIEMEKDGKEETEYRMKGVEYREEEVEGMPGNSQGFSFR